jgi:hypothetical protein
MSGFGSFSPEAYAKLQEAYANELSKAEEAEAAGVKIGNDTLGVETAPLRSAWLDKTGLWQYPDGKGEYQDKKQSPEDLLAALRNGEGEVELPEEELSDEEAAAELDSMTDEELDRLIDEILAEDDTEAGDEEEEEEEDDSVTDEVIEEVKSEDETVVADSEEEEVDDAISIAEKIAALKEELAALSASVDTEEGVEDEEPTPDVEETDSEEEPVEEEVTSDDEPA